MNLIEHIHGRHFASRRAHVLAHRISEILPQGASVLDVGSGDGEVDSLVLQHRPDVQIHGVDVLVRPKTLIPVTAFDGVHFPFPDQSFDAVTFVDVLHHVDDPMILLKEARRVTRRCIIIKDHLCDGLFAWQTLRFMDAVGNRRYGVALPYHYMRREEWKAMSAEIGMQITSWSERLNEYVWPLSIFFDRSLQVLMRWDTA